MRTKAFAVCAAIALAFSLSGCDDNASPGGGGGGNWPIFLPWFMPSPSITNNYNTPSAPRIVPAPKPVPAPAPKAPAPAPKAPAPAPKAPSYSTRTK